MRHLHFVQSIEPQLGGGLGTSTLELSDALNGIGCRSLVVATGTQTQKSPAVHVYKRTGWSRLFYSRELHSNAAQLVSQFDCVHAHGLYVGTNLVLGREAVRQKKRLIYHIHGNFSPYFLKRSRLKKRLAFGLFEKRNITSSLFLRAMTRTEEMQIKTLGYRGKIVVLPNGINIKTYDRCVPTDRLSGARTLLYLGRIHAVKNLESLVKAWAAVPPERLHDWRLQITGPGLKRDVESLKSVASRLRGRENIFFSDAVVGAEKVRMFKAAAAFILPSISEGLPVAALEAMAAGLPVIVSDACNLPEVHSRGCGWVCEPSVSGITSAIQDLIGLDDEVRRAKGESARSFVKSEYDWKTIARKLDDACAA